ncbi:MAG: autotransporter outer membrane beta-barrel domain-containing protein [Phascolarctobacterium sp.]|nr:autotransporter outer membrane beta-barrel domain-containing protein [Phascolarctobacterium sp.]
MNKKLAKVIMMGLLCASVLPSVGEAAYFYQGEDGGYVQDDTAAMMVIDNEPTEKRLNALRTDPSEVGVWIRGGVGETKIRDLKFDYNQMGAGYDWDYENDARYLFTGVSVTYATNECDDKYIGDSDSVGVSFYGSYLGKENNDYVDFIFKYGRLDKEFKATLGWDSATGQRIEGTRDYDKDLFSFAAKYGRRIEREDGWYWEPSVGLTYGRVGSATFKGDRNEEIYANSTESWIGSLGMQVGKNIKGIEYYGKVEVMHDFDGKIVVSNRWDTAEDDMGGTWVKCSIGASRKIDENNSFYLEVERDFGNKVEKPYGFSAGYRFTW